MKVGDKYKCIKTYRFSGCYYFLEDNIYTIKEIQCPSDDPVESKIIFDYNDGRDDEMFMCMDEMEEFFIPHIFKFGK